MGSTLHSAAGLSPDCMTIESQIAGDTDHLLSSIAEPSVKRIINNFYKNASSFHSKLALLSDSHSICPSLDLAKKAAHAFSSSSVYYYVASFEEPVTCANGTTPLRLAHSLSDISAILGQFFPPFPIQILFRDIKEQIPSVLRHCKVTKSNFRSILK